MKRVTATLVWDDANLAEIQKFYGGTAEQALAKFIHTQLCKQAAVEKVDIKRYVAKKKKSH